MNIIHCHGAQEVACAAADIFEKQLRQKPDSLLGLATGSSPLGTYAELAKRCSEGKISFKQVKSYNLDEYVGLKPDHDQSYAYFMRHNFFEHIDINPANTNIESGIAADMQAECERYSALLNTLEGGLDIQLLGIGPNGHIGFNEPDDVFTADTHIVDLTDATIDANARFFASRDEVPRHAITMGVRPIMRAKAVVLIAMGKNKAKAVADSVNGPVSPRCPASILQLRDNVYFVCDDDALSLLK